MPTEHVIGAIRLLAAHFGHEHDTLDVIAGITDLSRSTISYGQAHDLVGQGQAVWIGEPPANPVLNHQQRND